MTDEYNQEDERSFDETIDDAFDEDEAANAALERAFANLPTDEKKKNAGQPGHKLQKKWDEMYRRLLIFREKHGHCLVPNRYVDDPQLGSWVSTQRRHYKILTSGTGESTPMTPARAQKLVEIGFKWSTKDPRHVPWEQRYNELVTFKEKYGHAQVPIGWEENIQLSNWVSTQRQEYKLIQRGRQSRLSDDKIEKLNRLKFVWEAQRGGPRRKRKATIQVPSKANPVDIGRIKAKTCARAGKFKSVQQNEMMQQSQMRQQNGMKQQRQMRQPNVASPSMMPLQGQNEYMPASVGMFPVPIMGPHVAALSAANPGLIPGMFPGVLPGAAVPIAVPVVAGQQWQLLPNGAFQQMGAADATGLGGATLFPMATPMAMAPAGFQFGTPYGHPSMMAALQQQQQQQQAAYFFNSGMMAAPPDLGDDENLDTTNAEDDDDSTHLPLENGMGVVVGSNQMMNNIQMVNNMQMMNNSNNQKPFASSDADDDGKGSDAFYDG